MGSCRTCGTQLAGRQWKCDSCKTATGRPTKKTPPKPRPSSRAPRKKVPVKKVSAAPTKKAATKKAGPPPSKKAQRAVGPAALQARGRDLWRSLGKESGTPAGAIALEACRLADRLEDLDRIIAGKGVLQLMAFRLDHAFTVADVHEISVKVEFSNVLAEARQQQGALLRLLEGLGVAKSGTAPAPPPTRSQPAEQPKSPLDEVSARRQQREQKT